MYTKSFIKYNKRKTISVKIGDIEMGLNNPVRIQSMTNTSTKDVNATVEQTIRIADAGADYVRITVPTKKDADFLAQIKAELAKRGCNVPLIADIHFSPDAAIASAAICEKVRVNPGNYVDSKRFKSLEYTDEEYQDEINRIRERFLPLIEECKKQGTAMRIGTNHGSLSDRIMSRYGDTALGMAESTMEFLRVCQTEDYNDVVISMKASNPIVMIQACRLVVQKMESENMHYPLHLGVTEAGEGREGRIKSAMGIGSLLADGVGGTVRVSLTEEPELEIPVAKAICDTFDENVLSGFYSDPEKSDFYKDPYEYEKRKTFEVANIGGQNITPVIADLSNGDESITDLDFENAGFRFSQKLGVFVKTDTSADFLYIGSKPLPQKLKNVNYIVDAISDFEAKNCFKLYDYKSFIKIKKKHSTLNFVKITSSEFENISLENFNDKSVVFIFEIDNKAYSVQAGRAFFLHLMKNGIENPVIISQVYSKKDDEIAVRAAALTGPLFTDGFGDGIFLRKQNENTTHEITQISFGILQAARVRITKTEYISCPSCGRTLYSLQETTAKIHAKTSHLKGLKIGIMGCVVNGPGEMADADYGYVGTAPGKITLYKNKDAVKKHIAEEFAVEELINLIKEYGDWTEPEVEE